MKIVFLLSLFTAVALTAPIAAETTPVDVVRSVYGLTNFQWTQFATSSPPAFSTEFVSRWRQAMKFRNCNLYDGDILTGEGDGKRRLNSIAVTNQSVDRAAVRVNVSPDVEFDHPKNIDFEVKKDRGAWRIDDIVMPDLGLKTADGVNIPTSIKAYLALVIRTKCAHWRM